MYQRIAFRIGLLGAVFTSGAGAALFLSPEATPRASDCHVLPVCVTTAIPTLPLPTGTTVAPTESTPTTTAEPVPAPAPTPTPPPTPTTTGPAETAPPASERSPQAQLQVRLVRVTVSRRGERRTVVLTADSSRPARATLVFRARPRVVRAEFRLGAGRNVRRVNLPIATRSGRYLLTLTVRDGEGAVRTLSRRVSVRR